jgi:hypothetical protein
VQHWCPRGAVSLSVSERVYQKVNRAVLGTEITVLLTVMYAWECFHVTAAARAANDDHNKSVLINFHMQEIDSVYDRKLEGPSICKAMTFSS